MSREVLGGTEPGSPDDGTPGPLSPVATLPGQRSTTPVTELGGPADHRAAQASAQASARDTGAAPTPDAVELDDAEPDVRPAPADAETPTTAWWRSSWAVTAAAAAGALVATVITGGVLERRYHGERMSAVALVADFSGESSSRPHEGVINTTLVVLNPGPTSVELVDAAFADGGATIGLRSEATVPAGETVRVPVQVEISCDNPAPQRLELTVRTPDGRTRTTETTSAGAAVFGQGLLDNYWRWTCTDAMGPPIEIWSTTARDDGTLAFQVRNPTDATRQVEFRGPTGTRIVSDPPAPITIEGRSGDFIVLTVQVDRCTAAAQRANAADDLSMIVDGEDVGLLPTDPGVVAGWFARAVALHCG